jgi:hypothetical protein
MRLMRPLSSDCCAWRGIILLAVLIAASPAHASEEGAPPSFSHHARVEPPMGGLRLGFGATWSVAADADRLGSGAPHFMARVGWALSGRVALDAEWSNFGMFTLGDTFAIGSVSVWPWEWMGLYATGGFGYASRFVPCSDCRERANGLGIKVGIGYDLRLGGVPHLVLEAVYYRLVLLEQDPDDQSSPNHLSLLVALHFY